jgi:hypothetical protein
LPAHCNPPRLSSYFADRDGTVESASAVHRHAPRGRIRDWLTPTHSGHAVLPIMKKVAIGYGVAAACLCGWVITVFGVPPAFVAAIMLASPLLFWLRMATSGHPIKRREYYYLAILTTLVMVGMPFVIALWFHTGLDRLATLERESSTFRRHIAAMPEFANVEVRYTDLKGGHVFLEGSVASKEVHHRLIELAQQEISSYNDAVDYPGKSSWGESHGEVQANNKQYQDDSSKPR